MVTLSDCYSENTLICVSGWIPVRVNNVGQADAEQIAGTVGF